MLTRRPLKLVSAHIALNHLCTNLDSLTLKMEAIFLILDEVLSFYCYYMFSFLFFLVIGKVLV